LTVLIVDDAAFIRMVLRKIIEDLGYHIIGEAVDGEDAVEKVKELNPDIVTMNIVMPKMDGIEAVKEIMKIRPETYIIMCTALGQKRTVIQAFVAGAKDFLVKPFDKERVKQALKKYQNGSML
jgi:two-component system chemotaxis response regulator CheY